MSSKCFPPTTIVSDPLTFRKNAGAAAATADSSESTNMLMVIDYRLAENYH